MERAARRLIEPFSRLRTHCSTSCRSGRPGRRTSPAADRAGREDRRDLGRRDERRDRAGARRARIRTRGPLHLRQAELGARPAALGARPQIGRAVQRALRARGAKKVPLQVSFNRKRLDGYLARLDNRLSEPAVRRLSRGPFRLRAGDRRGPAGPQREPGDDEGADAIMTLRVLPPYADRAGRRASRAQRHAGELRAGHRRQGQVPPAPLLRGREPEQRVQRRYGPVRLPDAGRAVGDRPTMRRDPCGSRRRTRKWARPRSRPAGARLPLANAADGPVRAVRRDPRNARRGLAGYSESHGWSGWDSRRGVGLRPRPARDAGLHRLAYVPGRRLLPPGGARLRRRLPPLAAGSPRGPGLSVLGVLSCARPACLLCERRPRNSG